MEFEQLSILQDTGFKMKKVKPMKILVACEESQAVCIELRKLGHEAYSADIQECSGGFPQWHILGDVIPLINGDCKFTTMDGVQHEIVGEWDMLIAHPPCTYLTVTGNRWFNVEKYGEKAIERIENRNKAAEFFMCFANANCKKIVIENPVGYMGTYYRKCDQTIQPYYFGDAFEKLTCLWIKGLQKLRPTNIVNPQDRVVFKSGKSMPKWYSDAFRLNKNERSKLRSKTFPGIAKAMAEQWAGDARDYVEDK